MRKIGARDKCGKTETEGLFGSVKDHLRWDVINF